MGAALQRYKSMRARRDSRDRRAYGLIASIKSLEDSFDEDTEATELQQKLAALQAQATEEQTSHDIEAAELGAELNGSSGHRTPNVDDDLARKNLQLEHENAKLQRMVDSLQSSADDSLGIEQVRRDLRASEDACAKLEKEAQLLDQ